MISQSLTTAKPCLGSIYALQFKKMQHTSCDEEHNTMFMVETKELDSQYSYQHIVPRTTDIMEASPVVCSSKTGQPSPLQINISLKTHLQTLHDLVTHNISPMDLTLMEK